MSIFDSGILEPKYIEMCVVVLSDVRQKQWSRLKKTFLEYRESLIRHSHPYRIGQEVLMRNFECNKFEARGVGPFKIFG